MKKVVLTGCSCSLKSSVGKYVSKLTKFEFIKSDSQVLSQLREVGLSDWMFANRMALKYYMIQMLPDRRYIIERSILDQLIFCEIASEGWFEYEGDTILDVDKVMSNKDIFLQLESDCHIDNYILLKMYDENFIKSIIDQPDFMSSKRSDSFCSLDDYFELQSNFIKKYLSYISQLPHHPNVDIVRINSDSTNPAEITAQAGNKVLSILCSYD